MTYKKLNWIHYLSRPFGLFSASSWYHWYNSDITKRVLGSSTMKDVLFVEQPEGIARFYAVDKQHEAYKNNYRRLLENERDRTYELLKRGLELNKEAKKNIANNKFSEFKPAFDFVINLTLHATLLPYWIIFYLNELEITDKELLELSEKLRFESYYPEFYDKVLIKLAEKELDKLNQDKSNINLITVNELLSKNTEKINTRINESQGKKYIYQNLSGAETVFWEKNTLKIVKELEKEPSTNEIKGNIAFPGKVKGIARIVLQNYSKITEFNEGDILVAINTNPSLMPLLIKCRGIVTDEGGIMSHAAIVAREMKKPCVIGTRNATKVLKDNDIVEVDANKGIVRKI